MDIHRSGKKARFREIPQGGVFLDEKGDCCIRVAEILDEHGHKLNAISLEEGRAFFFEDRYNAAEVESKPKAILYPDGKPPYSRED